MKRIAIFLCLQLLAICSFAQQLTIPVVVHVVYNDDAYNMQDADIKKMLDTVSRNFAGLSVNNAIKRTIFDTLRANTGIQFCLVNKDTVGNPSTGIVRVKTSTTPIMGDVIFARRFSDAWDETRYCNIWIYSGTTTSAGTSGYTTTAISPGGISAFPDRPYGVSLLRGTNWVYLENVLTHELGHFLGLRHTFDALESIGDTPCSTDGSYDDGPCLSSYTTTNTCSTESSFWGKLDPPDMVENFMSYHIGCQYMFTKGQSARMRSQITGSYTTLLANKDVSCNAVVGIASLSVPGAELVYPNPATETIQFRNLDGPCSVTVINCLGERVLFCPRIMESQAITVQQLPAGLYYLQLDYGSRVRRLKLVKR